jgi:glycosyltransferase involved in cell wall biosynthesis
VTEKRIAVVLKGYPRLSETFIAQEILALERRGLPLEIWSLRQPTDRVYHPMHKAIRAPVSYLPEYLHTAPLRVLRGALAALRRPRLPALLTLFARDFLRDATASRLRRFGQALVLARELPAAVTHIHVHFLHTPASVARYAALLTGREWSFSAHAKDIWTTPNWELTEKLDDARWGVTCTRDGQRRLDVLAPGRTLLAYHGLDLGRFPAPPQRETLRDGSDAAAPLRLLCVGRLVAKKGHDDLIDALAELPATLHWRLDLIGGGELRGVLEEKIRARGLAERVTFRGSLAQPAVIAAMREADLFVLPTKPGPGGDRDGLPNVLMEAASQALPILATAFGGTPEFIDDGVHGVLVRPGEPAALTAALIILAGDPHLRHRLGDAARVRLVQYFSEETAVTLIAGRLRMSAGLGAAATDSAPEVSACAS